MSTTKQNRKPTIRGIAKPTAEQVARAARIRERLDDVHRAIEQGRAYLMTAWGRRTVVGYNHDTGDAVTNNSGRDTDRRTFLICLDSIKID